MNKWSKILIQGALFTDILTMLYNKEQKNHDYFKIEFLIFIFIKIHHTIYQIEHNWMDFLMVKTVYKTVLNQMLYTSLKTTNS